MELNTLFEEAERLSQFSGDTSTKVGAVLLDSDGGRMTCGWNDIPHGVIDTPARRERPLKYKYVVHAEANAICTAARNGYETENGTIVTTHHPCSDCAKLIIQAGIKTVAYDHGVFGGDWGDDCAISAAMLHEAGVKLIARDKSA